MRKRYVLACKDVCHWFNGRGRRKNVLYNVTFEVLEGEIVAMVGPSGCGKSTLLRAMVGTHPPEKGEVVVYSAEQQTHVINGPSRRIGIVYQHYTLFPFLTALENVALGPMLDQASLPFRCLHPFKWHAIRKQHLDEAAALLTKLGLGNALKQYPAQLSGGMCQRVAVAQALIMKPQILLLDEPFGALDEATRSDLQQMLLSLYCDNLQAIRKGEPPACTIVLVTHELEEAIYVGDRVLGLSQYWNWAEQGHAECPGATIVYDEVAPVYAPDRKEKSHAAEEQRAKILEAVFDPRATQNADEFRRFWQQVANGEGKGVLDVQGA